MSIKLSASLKFVPSRLHPRTKMVIFFFFYSSPQKADQRQKDAVVQEHGVPERLRMGAHGRGGWKMVEKMTKERRKNRSRVYGPGGCRRSESVGQIVTEVNAVMTEAEHTSVGDTRTHTHTQAGWKPVGRRTLTPRGSQDEGI